MAAGSGTGGFGERSGARGGTRAEPSAGAAGSSVFAFPRGRSGPAEPFPADAETPKSPRADAPGTPRVLLSRVAA